MNDSSPKRAFTISIELGGDTIEDAVQLARHFLSSIENGSRHIVTGGYSSGGVLEVTERPGLTHDQFSDELDKYLETVK